MTMIIPTIPSLCRFEKKVEDGEVKNRRGVREHDEEEEERSQKKEQLTVIIVMFNQTPAIKLINTLFPVWLRIHWVPLRHCSAL